jgi:soluble lytic murein transglycosylase
MGQGRFVVLALSAAVLLSCSAPPAPAPAAPAAAPVAVAQPVVTTVDEARTLLREGRAADYERALQSLATSTDAQTRRRATALLALYLHEQKRYDEAVPLLHRAATLYPEVAPFLHLRVVDAEVARNRIEAAIGVASEIVALGESSAVTVARLRLPALFARAGETASTDQAWQLAMEVPIDELTELDYVNLAKELAEAGRTDLASKTRMRLLRDYTSGRFTEQTYGFLAKELKALPVNERLAIATKLSRANRYDQALELFESIPGGVAEGRGARLRALFNSRNYTQLLTETQGVTLDDPSLVLLRARAAWRDGKPQELLAGLDDIEKRFPASREASEAKIIRAKYYVTDVVDYAKSIDNLSRAIAAGAVGNDGENVWNLGWTYFLAGRHIDALATFDRYIRTYPDGDWKTNSLFWSAKIHDRLGRTAERDAKARQLVAEYPVSYYAYRLRELWPAAVNDVPAKSTLPFPDLDSELGKVSDPRFATVEELQEIDLDRAAAREMKVLAAKYADNPGVQFMLADVYVAGGEPFKANGVLQRTFRPFVRHGGTNVPSRFWEILFPLAYWDTIQAEAKRRELDPYLVASIIRQESGFEPSTVSNAGAVGLMQIMPAEASRIATAGGLGEITRDDLFDPEKNIAVGAAEYSQKLALWNGRHVLAIASYNAGERAVGTWIEKTPVDDHDLFVESIPYAETRLYVKTVSRNRYEYRRIYEGNRRAASQPQGATP